MSERTAAHPRRGLAYRSRRVVDSSAFTSTVFCLIAASAVLPGIETYSGVVHQWHGALKAAEHFFLAAFTTEILLRAAAHADRPRDFFRDPWNVFDLLVVGLAFMPFARENATVLRLLRLARVLRAARFLPQLRIVIVAVGKSLPGTGVVINSLEEARELEKEREGTLPGQQPQVDDPTESLRAQLAAARHALDTMESSLVASPRPCACQGAGQSARTGV